MKKIMFMALAAVAMSFAACGGKTGAAADSDSLAVEATEAAAPAEQANQVVALLQEQIQNADPEQVKAISQQVAEQVSAFIAAGDEAAAEAYTKVINTFICENVEKLQQSGAATAIAEAIATVQNVPAAIVESTTQAATGVVADANAQAEAAAATVEATKQAIEAASSRPMPLSKPLRSRPTMPLLLLRRRPTMLPLLLRRKPTSRPTRPSTTLPLPPRSPSASKPQHSHPTIGLHHHRVQPVFCIFSCSFANKAVLLPSHREAVPLISFPGIIFSPLFQSRPQTFRIFARRYL